MANVKEYRALTGLDWVDEEGKEHHAGAGDKITNIPENVLKSETAAGNVEEWVERQTENVKNEPGVLYGVFTDDKGNVTVVEGETNGE